MAREMTDESKSTRSHTLPAVVGIVSFIAAAAWGYGLLIFDLGPEGSANSPLSLVIGLHVLPGIGVVAGLIPIGAGIYRKKWGASVCGSVGLVSSPALFMVLFVR